MTLIMKMEKNIIKTIIGRCNDFPMAAIDHANKLITNNIKAFFLIDCWSIL